MRFAPLGGPLIREEDVGAMLPGPFPKRFDGCEPAKNATEPASPCHSGVGNPECDCDFLTRQVSLLEKEGGLRFAVLRRKRFDFDADCSPRSATQALRLADFNSVAREPRHGGLEKLGIGFSYSSARRAEFCDEVLPIEGDNANSKHPAISDPVSVVVVDRVAERWKAWQPADLYGKSNPGFECR